MKMYRVELDDEIKEADPVVSYETGESKIEALEIVLGRLGLSVKVEEVNLERNKQYIM